MHPHVSLGAAFIFLKKWRKWAGATHFTRGDANLKGVQRHLSLRPPMLCENRVLNFISEILGIDKIIWEFIAKSDCLKSPKSKFNLSMPKRTPKWRSPNIGERKLKWVITVRRPKISFKCSKTCEWKWTASRNTSSSECAIFPKRQPYFTYGGIQSSRPEIQATQQTINKGNTCRYSDCFKMCL